MKSKITIIMTTFNNNDFTKSAVWAVRKFYSDMRIILVDGGSKMSNYGDYREFARNDKNIDLLQYDNGLSEDCRNMAAILVDTPFILFMDNDTKILNEDAVDALLEVMVDSSVAETGVYGIIIVDKEKRIICAGTEYNKSMQVDGFSCYFALHRTDIFREVSGMPKEYLFSGIPKEVEEESKITGYAGDFMIAEKYKKIGYRVASPNRHIPIVHWGQAYRWNVPVKPFEEWFRNNITVIRCNPLNNWKKIYKGEMK